MKSHFKLQSMFLSKLLQGSIFVVWLCLLSAACSKLPIFSTSEKAKTASIVARSVELDSAFFDRLVTLETIFPDQEQRNLYLMHSPISNQGERTYMFQLIPQSGMNEARHFHFISITWARRGQPIKAPGSVTGVGGPNGAFIDVFFQTEDHLFDVHVSQGVLLPNEIKIPAVDVERIATDMVRRYKLEKINKE